MTASRLANRALAALRNAFDAPRLILASALAIGAFLRFHHLDAAELSNDEAASWVSAAVPTIRQVVRFDYHANPGKLAFHTILLHLWMPFCGDDVWCLRVLSACLGTLTLLLVYVVTRELLAQSDGVVAFSDKLVDEVAASSALICSVMLVLVRYSREARMYGLLLALVLAQILFFLRVRRVRTIYNYAAVALFTALAIGSNMTALLVVAAEALWIVVIASREKRMPDALASAFAPSAALTMGLLLLLPFVQGFKAGVHGLRIGDLDWIVPLSRWEPFASFESATGSTVFPLMMVLAIVGALSWWRERRSVIAFALIWMWLPPVVLLIVSYFSSPVLVTRYMLSSFVPFFILAALGLSALKGRAMRFGTLSVLLLLAFIRLHSYDRKPHDEQVREAVQTALADTPEREPIAVLGNESHAARFYFPAAERDRIVVFPASEALPLTGPRFLIMAPSTDPAVAAVYPHTVARFRGVEVREHR